MCTPCRRLVVSSLGLLLIGSTAAPAQENPDERFLGVKEWNGELTIEDPVLVLGRLFRGQPGALDGEKAADADDNGLLELTDAVNVLAFLFTGAQAPPPPLRACGADPTEDGLTCQRHAPCE